MRTSSTPSFFRMEVIKVRDTEEETLSRQRLSRRYAHFMMGYYDKPSLIIEGLYMGNYFQSLSWETCKAYNFDHVINMGVQAPDSTRVPFSFFNILDRENSNILQYFISTTDIIEKYLTKKKNVYVHCYAGISRSSTIVAAYLIRFYRMTTDEAISYIKERRSRIKPNNGFIEQLREWEIACSK